MPSDGFRPLFPTLSPRQGFLALLCLVLVGTQSLGILPGRSLFRGAGLCCKLLLHTLQAAGAAGPLPRLTHTHLEKEAPAESADEYGCLNPHDGSG